MYRSITAAKRRSSVRVLCVTSDEISRAVPRALRRIGASSLQAPGFSGDNGETTILDSSRLLLGLGKRDNVSASSLRIAGSRVVRALERMKAPAANIELHDSALTRVMPPLSIGRSFGEGMAIANWRVTEFDGAASTRKRPRGSLAVDTVDRRLREGLAAGLALGASVNYARGLAATPPNICTPAWIAREAKRLARAERLRCRVITFAHAQRLGMGGLVNVGRGSDAKPCLVVLEWKPARLARAARGVHLCLVGKTITYDTGGYSLKINNTMKGMKYDKCGGTAVLGAMQAIAAQRLPVHVTALLPAAENMVSGDAYRPDDIITMHNGVTVEVTNTDAEGRLVLGDALAWASRTLKPSHIVDIATLTGGVVTALGSWCAGLMCNDDALRERVERAGTASGDRVWRLPLWPEHREHLRSQHADIINSNPSRLGHPLQGGAFLSYFVSDRVPWAHVDIAGVASVDGANDLCAVPGPTGFGVRLLYEVASGFTV